MKYLVAVIVTMAVMGVFVLRHPMPDSLLPVWLEVVVSPLIMTVPLCLATRLLTRKMEAVRARITELAILFCLVGGYWALTKDLTVGGRVASPLRFWFGLTIYSWATAFLPFVGALAVIEWWTARKREVVPSK